MKELSDTEINAYLNILNDTFTTTDNTITDDTFGMGANGTTEMKPPTTIDEMMSQYISGLETSFPSIVSTTGHTAEKLDFPEIDEREGGSCLVCSMPKQRENVKAWLDDITVTQAAPDEAEGEREGVEEDEEGRVDVTGEVCYGCYTLFRGLRGIVAWPI